MDTDEDIANLAADLLPALDVYHAAQRLFLIFNTEKDKIRFERLCRYIVASLQSDSVKLSYVGVFLMKEHRFVIRIIQIKFSIIVLKFNLFLQFCMDIAHQKTIVQMLSIFRNSQTRISGRYANHIITFTHFSSFHCNKHMDNNKTKTFRKTPSGNGSVVRQYNGISFPQRILLSIKGIFVYIKYSKYSM